MSAAASGQRAESKTEKDRHVSRYTEVMCSPARVTFPQTSAVSEKATAEKKAFGAAPGPSAIFLSAVKVMHKVNVCFWPLPQMTDK